MSFVLAMAAAFVSLLSIACLAAAIAIQVNAKNDRVVYAVGNSVLERILVDSGAFGRLHPDVCTAFRSRPGMIWRLRQRTVPA